MEDLIPLNSLAVGEYASVRKINLCGGIRRRLMDIGLVPDSTVKCVSISPCGDPHAYLIHGAVIAIRNTDAEKILIKKPRDCNA